ncbi:MAG TPA: sigma factor, partial [Sunxiuqinia sp.]|nr:sigma factor [Sunxiuqinia sp.]
MKKLDLYTDQNLAARLKDDDQLAFEVLFYKYKNKLKGFVKKLAPPQVDPEEIVQKVFIKVWIQRARIDAQKSFSS